jgi:hypothetical protein
VKPLFFCVRDGGSRGAGETDLGGRARLTDLSLAIADAGGAYERDFGCRADFRAGLHCCSVVVGELGHLKKEIALIGDSSLETVDGAE